MTRKETKKSLALSALSLLMCVVMLAGLTFAWFTDSVTNKGNRIQAGNLKIDLLMDKDGIGNEEYVSIADGNGDIFSAKGNGIKWEPGKTEIVYLAVKNKGNLAINYNILLNVKDGGLANALEYAVLDGKKATDLEGISSWTELKAMVGAQTGDVKPGEVTAAPNGTLDEIINGVEGETQYFALAVHMKESAGNEYAKKSITIDVNVVAKQAMAENDSFDNTYDEGAYFPTDKDAAEAGNVVKVDGKYYKGVEEAVTKAEPGDTVTLIADAAVASPIRFEADDKIILDLNDKTLTANNGTAVNMKNGGELTLINGTIESKTYAVYAGGNAVIHDLNVNISTGYWGIYLTDNAVLEKISGGTYESYEIKGQNVANFPIYVSTNAKIGEIADGEFYGSKAAIANYGRIDKISGGVFHGTYYDGTNRTIWDPDYSIMYRGTIGQITGGTFFEGKSAISQNMTTFNAALEVGGCALSRTDKTATIVYGPTAEREQTYTGYYYNVVPK